MSEFGSHDGGFDELRDIIKDYTSSTSALSKTGIAKRSLSNEEDESIPKRLREFSNIEEVYLTEERRKYLEKILFNKKDDFYNSLAEIGRDDKNKHATNYECKPEPVWHDHDDDHFRVNDIVTQQRNNAKLSHTEVKNERMLKDYLVDKFHNIHAAPKWADLDRMKETDSDEEILKTVGLKTDSFTYNSFSLPSAAIQAKRLKDLNRDSYAEGNISSVQFHPTAFMGMVAGNSGGLGLYSLDGTRNEKLYNVLFRKYPIKCAKIFDYGNEIIIGSSKKYYYTVDLITGKEKQIFLPRDMTNLSSFELSQCGKFMAVVGRFGAIHLMDAKSKELLHTFHQEGTNVCLQFTPDSSRLLAHSNGSSVFIFNLKQQKPEHIFIDDGCIHGSTIAISPSGGVLATGSDEGVVNVYDYNSVYLSKCPQPKKIIYNLTTSITKMVFNHTSEILAMCSKLVPNGVKLYHVSTETIYQNFPGQEASLGHATALAFSPHSGYMASGNREHKAPFFRLKHFKKY